MFIVPEFTTGLREVTTETVYGHETNTGQDEERDMGTLEEKNRRKRKQHLKGKRNR